MSADGTTGDRCRFKDLCIDATDQRRLAAFWASALGLGAEALDNGAYRLADGVAEHTVWINPVPEPRTVKQRVHLDVAVARRRRAARDRGRGGRRAPALDPAP